jgi:hypothetical protein
MALLHETFDASPTLHQPRRTFRVSRLQRVHRLVVLAVAGFVAVVGAYLFWATVLHPIDAAADALGQTLNLTLPVEGGPL